MLLTLLLIGLVVFMFIRAHSGPGELADAGQVTLLTIVGFFLLFILLAALLGLASI